MRGTREEKEKRQSVEKNQDLTDSVLSVKLHFLLFKTFLQQQDENIKKASPLG